jgi:hypothetical protein
MRCVVARATRLAPRTTTESQDSDDRRGPQAAGWKSLRSIPFLGLVRVARAPGDHGHAQRFRTKHNLWPYAGLAVVTRSSADQESDDGKGRQRDGAPRTRGLNRNHNPVLKSIFKEAATAAAVKAGPLQDLYDAG